MYSIFTGLPDQGYEDSDNSSVFSTPSPQTKQREITSPYMHSTGQSAIHIDTGVNNQHPSQNLSQHTSLKRKKKPPPPVSGAPSHQVGEYANLPHHRSPAPGVDMGRIAPPPLLEKSQSLQGDLVPRPLSMVIPTQSEANVIVNPQTGSLHRQVILFSWLGRVGVGNVKILPSVRFHCLLMNS